MRQRRVLESIEKAWTLVYDHSLAASVTAGGILGIAKAVELYPHLGSQYFDSDIDRAVQMTPGAFMLYVGTRTAMWAGITYLPLALIRHAGGVRNLGRILRYESTPKGKIEQRKRRLDELCDTTRVTPFKIERARIAMLEDMDLNSAIEHIRRATADAVREEYRETKGRAEHKRWGLTRVMNRNLGRSSMDDLHKLESLATELVRQPEKNTSDDKAPHKLQEIIRTAPVMRKHLSAFIDAREGRLDAADTNLNSLCETEPKITHRCVYGSFLDTVAAIDDDYKERARRHWASLINDIITSPEFGQQFVQLPGSKNEVLEFGDDLTKKSMLIVKRSGDRGELEREFKIAQFLYDFLGQRGIVPEALTFKQHDEKYYFIQKRVPGRTLHEMIKTTDNRTEVITALLETLDQYQRGVQQNKEAVRRYDVELKRMDYEEEFNAKFVERVRTVLPAYDFGKIQDRIKVVTSVLEQQRTGGCHGDLHYRNGIVHDGKRICIIDSEKLFWGVRILDWVNFIVHAKVDGGIDLTGHVKMGYDMFKKRGMSMDSYLAAWYCGAVFQASQLAGTVQRYSQKSALDNDSVREQCADYLGEAIAAFDVLKELLPANASRAIMEIRQEYVTIREQLLPARCISP